MNVFGGVCLDVGTKYLRDTSVFGVEQVRRCTKPREAESWCFQHPTKDGRYVTVLALPQQDSKRLNKTQQGGARKAVRSMFDGSIDFTIIHLHIIRQDRDTFQQTETRPEIQQPAHRTAPHLSEAM